ncbi:MlaA family lipoprotein [Kaarinaea lacus]
MKLIKAFQIILISTFTTACATIEGEPEPHDPFERYNRAMYEFNEDLDNAIVKPVAKAYNKILPQPVNKGITNFFSNINDVQVMANEVLQLKMEEAISDFFRIIFNTTIGVVGFIDVASDMGFERHQEDFGQTLGYWGVANGPYFVLPFFGPSTIRDSVGLGVDYAVFYPIFNRIDRVAVQNTLFGLDLLDTRAGYLGAGRVLEVAALDPYIFVREAYLQRRRYLVYDGDPPMEDFDDFE